MRARDGFDPDGARTPLPEARTDRALGVFIEYGLTDRATLRFKGDWQRGRDAFVDYEGRGPVEIGLSWRAWSDARNTVGLYGGYSQAGEGRNAGYAAPGAGEHDWEARLAYGRDLGSRLGAASFVEVEAARRLRDGLPDETRVDATLGARRGDWLALAQAYAGAADGGARWLSLEASVTRDFGRWSLQAGWRRTAAGREAPISEGPMFAVWRRF